MGRGNLKLTTGYGTSESQMAIMRGEVDGKFTSWYSFTALIDSGEGIPVLFIGNEKPPGYEYAPLLQEIVKEERHQPVVELLTGMQLVGRPFAGPPNIPSDRLKILQEAFKKSFQDKELIKEIRKIGKPVQYIGADEALRRSNAILELPDEIVKSIKEAYGVK